MGNSNTRESRPPGATESHEGYRSSDGRSRHRGGRSDASFLGISTTSQRDRRQNVPFEHRETKQEREARRLERERATRLKERERSLREEHVDGGYLVTLGTYMGTEDFNKPVVRQLQVYYAQIFHTTAVVHEADEMTQIERRLAPFWRGLNDWSEHWAEHQLVAAARGLPIPAADEPPPPELIAQPHNRNPSQLNLHNLTVPIGERSMSTASDHSGSGTTSGLASPGTPTRGAIKPRAKALAMALTGHSRNASSAELPSTETSLPHDPFVNGQLLEVYLYKDAADCPICFLSYPPYLNSTRCCDQAICSECFVQIKRADPHLREHHPDGQARDPNQELAPEEVPEMLISEPSACPYCQQPEFGVTYEPPPFRRGLVYSTSSTNLASSSTRSPMSSQSSLHSTANPNPMPQAGRRRGHSLSANAPNVITTDRIRPDWSTKLATARAHQARRAAAATALHTAAFLVGGSDQRSILRTGRFGRRRTDSASGSGTPGNGLTAAEGTEPSGPSDQAQTMLNPDGTRRMRMDELEDMMFMEAVRLSLAAEEERKKKEAKALRKDAKKREQAEKKAAKKAAKDPYGGSVSGASGSSLSLGLGRKRGNSGASNLRMELTVQGASQAPKGDDQADVPSQKTHDGTPGDNTEKGKSIDRGETEASVEGSSSSAIPIRSGGSHLRQMSNASSLGSSLADSAPGSFSGAGLLNVDGFRQTRGEGSDGEEASEPLFNFRSLAELVGVDLDEGAAIPEENGDAARKKPGETSQETSARPLSQVKEEDELATGHNEKEEIACKAGAAKTEEESNSQRNMQTEEALDSGQDLEQSKDGESRKSVVLIEDVLATERR
ncbi:C2H2 zinc finger protein [Cordyceps javanica]|uniref:C2H2 zinc finger protein n=1 Tax=Cordyceps javanica TaxID=43265 RepID=A0A545W8I3_9HYPO|nr:C2H2 zinc finger protein [Cordyceps javanica]TQW10252.1 C2H2 zinc finger protein [Cordyceps javanica]